MTGTLWVMDDVLPAQNDILTNLTTRVTTGELVGFFIMVTLLLHH